jgi:hypothetical protein
MVFDRGAERVRLDRLNTLLGEIIAASQGQESRYFGHKL